MLASQSYNETMGPDHDRWGDAHKDNMQIFVEIPPSEEASTDVPLASRNDVEII